MKTILFNFAFDDFKAREVLLSSRQKLANLGYDTLSSLDLRPGEDFIDASSDFIKRASVVIAFVTDRNANVLFETGYAYGLGKRVVLVSDMSALPFDLRTVASIDARSSPSEIAFEIVRQISRLESSGWQPEVELPNNLRDMLAIRMERPELFELVSEESFVRAIAEEFVARGWEVQRGHGPQESGFDLRMRDHVRRSMLVEIKKRNPNSKVSISTVQQLLGAAHAYGDSLALLICTSGFTDSAREFAMRQSLQIKLWTLAELEEFAKHGVPSSVAEWLIKSGH